MIYNGSKKPPLGIKLNRNHWLSKGLVGCWLFNEGMGNKAYDLSGYGNHGTLENMAFPGTPTSGWNPGMDGVGLTFDGTSSYINCGNDSSLEITDAITIEAWAKPNTINGICGIVGKHSSTINAGGTVRFSSANVQILINIGGSYSSFSTNNNPITANKWHHIAYVYTGSNEYIYVDSIVKEMRGNSGVIFTPVPHNYIGATYGPTHQNFNGAIDGVKTYNRALSALEIQQLYMHPYAMFEVDDSWVLQAGTIKPPMGTNIAAAKFLL